MSPEELERHINEWKKEYESVYKVILKDKEETFIMPFIFRNVGREEYKQILDAGMELAEFQEYMCETYTLYPENYDFRTGLAGIAESLTDAIMESSGLIAGQSKDILNYYRSEMEIYDYQVDCLIHEAFPEYSIPEIQTWSIDKTMYYLSRAEFTLMMLRGVPIQQVGLEEEEVQQQPEQQEYDHHFEKQEMPPEMQQQVKEPPQEPEKKDGNELSEQEVLDMLGAKEQQHGRNVHQPISSMDDEVFPELSWFKAEEDLTGNYD